MKKIVFMCATAGFLNASFLFAASIAGKDASIAMSGIRPQREISCMIPRGWEYSAIGEIGDYFLLPETGPCRIRVSVRKPFPDGCYPLLGIYLDHYLLAASSVTQGKNNCYEFREELPSGVRRLSFSFIVHRKPEKNNQGLRPDQEMRAEADAQTRGISGLRLSEYISAISIEPENGGAVRRSTEKAWSADAGRRERDVLKSTVERIGKYRKYPAEVKVVDASGIPVPGARLKISQISREFLFGCNIFQFNNFKTDAMKQKLRRRFAELFNFAVTWLYWNGYEPKEGVPHYWETENVCRWAEPLGIKVKGHPVLWDFPIHPKWIKGHPTEEQQRRRVDSLLRRFRGKVSCWDVLNEPSHGLKLTVDLPYRTARAADPDACLVMNDNAVLGNGYPPFLALLKDSLERDIPFDAIGIQAHEPALARFPLDQVIRYLDRYAELGKKIHITEFELPSQGQPIGLSHKKGVWDEAAQEEYVTAFYRVCFSHPAVAAIGYWSFADTNGAWLKGGGLLRSDLSPKPAYTALRKLIHEEWNTRMEIPAKKDGSCSFRGFAGKYRITAESEKGTAASDFILHSDSPNLFLLKLEK